METAAKAKTPTAPKPAAMTNATPAKIGQTSPKHSAVPLQVQEQVNRLWTTEPERRFAVKAWKHANGIRKSQGTPHGLTKEQAAAIIARVADLTR
ncbi:MAG: hypothetical protein ACRDG6_11225 [Candidatus Limnocylindria bacterium]